MPIVLVFVLLCLFAVGRYGGMEVFIKLRAGARTCISPDADDSDDSDDSDPRLWHAIYIVWDLLRFYILLEVFPLSVIIACTFLTIFPPAWLLTWFLESVFLTLITVVALCILLPVVPVYVGRKQLAPPLAYHWAARIGPSMWFEVNGASMAETGQPNRINEKFGSTSQLGVEEAVWVGYATAIRTLRYEDFCQSWIVNHPTYDLHSANCQHFVRSFTHNLCGDRVANRLPLDDHEKCLHVLADVAPSIGRVFQQQWSRGFRTWSPSGATSNPSQDRLLN